MKVFPISFIRTRTPPSPPPTSYVWTYRNSPIEDGWMDGIYANGKYLAVGPNGKYMISTDAINWTITGVIKTGMGRGSIAYGNGTFVKVAENPVNGQIATSPDGMTWTERTAPAMDYVLSDITYGNGLFVTVAGAKVGGGTIAGNKILTSLDGINWTSRSHPDSADGTTFYSAVKYDGGKFVALGVSNSIYYAMTSSDGITWIKRSLPSNTQQWTKLAYGAGKWVAHSWTGPSASRIATSTDGITWTLQNNPGADTTAYKTIAYGNGRFLATAGSTDYFYSSINGTNDWQKEETFMSALQIQSIAGIFYGDKVFVMIASSISRPKVVATYHTA